MLLPEEQRLPNGMRVVLGGLGSRPELNGTTGTILGFHLEKQRYEVSLSSGEAIRLKPSSVQPAPHEPPTPSHAQSAHYEVLKTAHLMKENNSKPLPVTVLSGFLGSGKTTLLNHLLSNRDDGLRIALIVNDMASLNIDAELVRRGGLVQQEEKMVELSNGCICCTLREDLLTSIASLAAEQRFDHVLIESSGISEPLPVAETFTFKDEATGARLSDIARLQNMITVVDAASIFDQLSTLDMLADRGWQADKGDRRTVAQLLCDQLEFADVLVVNKADLVSEAQLGTVEALMRRVNPKAEVLRTTHSKVEAALLLNKARFDMARAEEHPEWLKEAREHEHTPETIEYGISSFVFRASRPFHPERLHVALGGDPNPPRAGALSQLLRVKGFAWLATWTSRQGVMALAGTQFTLTPGQPWWASVRREHWPAGLADEIEKDWHEQHGDRKTELVCIGQDLNHAAAQVELEACLLTDAEMMAGKKSWYSLRDPFWEAWEAEKSMAQGHAHHEEHVDQLAQSVTHVLILHKSESVDLGAAIGVMEMAGISASVAHRLLTTVSNKGRAIVCQGKEDDMKLMARLFDEIGMDTTMQVGSAPHK